MHGKKGLGLGHLSIFWQFGEFFKKGCGMKIPYCVRHPSNGTMTNQPRSLSIITNKAGFVVYKQKLQRFKKTKSHQNQLQKSELEK
jgi:hypothetical protein